jgi:hypothetical protein
MPGCQLLAIPALLSFVSVPAMAQRVISEPGYGAFFHPNCQNKGPGNPYTGGGNYQRGYYRDDGMSAPGQNVGVVPSRQRAPRTATRPQ